MNFTEVDELIQMPFEKKIDYSLTVIEKQITQDSSVVAFSGGKQSLVLLHLIREFQPDVKVIYNNTGVDYPEVPVFVEQLREKWCLNLEVLKPEKNFWECLKQYGWPWPRKQVIKGQIKASGLPRCCYYLKEKPMKLFMKANPQFDRIFLGLTASESRQRKYLYARYGTCYTTNRIYGFPVTKINPLMPWTDEDTWRYIKENNLPYCPAYDKYDLPRLGCWTCTSFYEADWKKQMIKFSPKFYSWVMRDMARRGDPRAEGVMDEFLGDVAE